MKLRLKPLAEQVVVITGASSGIGLVTARMAGRRGAKLLLAARSGQSLEELRNELEQAGVEAVSVAADVGRADDMQRVAQTAIEHFGGFDTWVNNAGVSVYGRIEDVPLKDHRRLFETNFWGVVHGSLAAVDHLREHGGALINIGSILSDRAVPLQGMYSASKHAVKGFTDALRMELERDGAPISVTLIKPSAIDTPYTRHAKNYMPVEPKNPPPVYAPELVAGAILHCAETPARDVTVGGGGKAIAALGTYAPRLMDKIMEWTMFDQQRTDKPARGRRSNSLFRASKIHDERGPYEGHTRETSLYTMAARYPAVASALLVGASLAVASLLQPRE